MPPENICSGINQSITHTYHYYLIFRIVCECSSAAFALVGVLIEVCSENHQQWEPDPLGLRFWAELML